MNNPIHWTRDFKNVKEKLKYVALSWSFKELMLHIFLKQIRLQYFKAYILKSCVWVNILFVINIPKAILGEKAVVKSTGATHVIENYIEYLHEDIVVELFFLFLLNSFFFFRNSFIKRGSIAGSVKTHKRENRHFSCLFCSFKSFQKFGEDMLTTVASYKTSKSKYEDLNYSLNTILDLCLDLQ